MPTADAQTDAQDVPEGTLWRRVKMSETLALALGASRVDWGTPDAEGFYNPTLYRDDGITCRHCGQPLPVTR